MDREYTSCIRILWAPCLLHMGRYNSGCGPGWIKNVLKTQCSYVKDVQAQPACAFVRHRFKTAIEIPANICWQQLRQKYKGRKSLAVESSFSAPLIRDSRAGSPLQSCKVLDVLLCCCQGAALKPPPRVSRANLPVPLLRRVMSLKGLKKWRIWKTPEIFTTGEREHVPLSYAVIQ